MRFSTRWSLLGVGLLACSPDTPSRPPPLPAAPPPVVAPSAPAPELPEPAPASKAAARGPGATNKAVKPSRTAPTARPAVTPRAPVEPPAAQSTPARAPAPAPTRPAPPAPTPPAPARRVQVPRTANVHVELPAGLQSDLDADPRMQKWVDRVVSVADGCHAKNRAATGTIEVLITMHENERPSASLRSLPAPLSGIVSCATGGLLGVKMPLFTGREGTRYPVRIVFE